MDLQCRLLDQPRHHRYVYSGRRSSHEGPGGMDPRELPAGSSRDRSEEIAIAGGVIAEAIPSKTLHLGIMLLCCQPKRV